MLMNPKLPLIVSFHTLDPIYTAAADRLRASLIRFNLPHVIAATPPAKSWHEGCAAKAEFILECFRTWRRSVLWVDADAEFVDNPRPLLGYENFRGVDFAAYMNKDSGGRAFPLVNSNLCSGTLYFAKSDAAALLLNNWMFACHKRGAEVYDQELLYELVIAQRMAGDRDRRLAAGNLDPSLCCVPDLMPGVVPIILQHQASRSQSR